MSRRHGALCVALALCFIAPTSWAQAPPDSAEQAVAEPDARDLQERVAQLAAWRAEVRATNFEGDRKKLKRGPKGWGKARWGMSPKKLAGHYPDLVKDEVGSLWLEESTYLDHRVSVRFDFEDEKLAMITFRLLDDLPGRHENTERYSAIDDRLDDMFGEPEAEGLMYLTDVRVMTIRQAHTAVEDGLIMFAGVFPTKRARITQFHDAPGGEFRHCIVYQSTRYQLDAKKRKRARTKK